VGADLDLVRPGVLGLLKGVDDSYGNHIGGIEGAVRFLLGTLLLGNKTMDRLLAVNYPKLGKDMSEVILDGLLADVEAGTYAPVVHALGQIGEDFQLLATQSCQSSSPHSLLAKEGVKQLSGQAPIHPDLPLIDGSNCG